MQFLRSGRNSTKSDDEIITAYKESKDPEYIAILFDRYCHLVFAVAMKYLKNEDDSKDTVLKVFEKLPSDLIAYNILHFSAWIHTVTKNHCMKFLSSRKFYSSKTENIAADIEEEDDFKTIYLPHLEKAILELNDEQRICIDLFYLQNLSYTEVSERSGFSMNQVKSYIQNGKRNLKIILTKKANEK
jgi:RNA polymerase sigma factor (sigma-70 family)